MDLTVADKVKLEYFNSPFSLKEWAVKRNLLENPEVLDKLDKLNTSSFDQTPLTSYEKIELSLLPNRHLVEEWAARNNKVNHLAVKTRIKDLDNLVSQTALYFSSFGVSDKNTIITVSVFIVTILNKKSL